MRAWFVWYYFFKIPLVFFLRMLPQAKKRIQFEDQNEAQDLQKKADVLFHISSEGELEQVLIIIKDYLAKKELVEILYTSPSVDHKIQGLKEEYPDLIRAWRFPFLSLKPNLLKNWVSADKIICCRYDLFPELMELVLLKKSILCSATFINQKKKILPLRVYYRWCYRQFDLLFWASAIDPEFLSKSYLMDFRVPQIQKRLALAKETLTPIASFVDFLKKTNKQKIIWGSTWLEELDAFAHYRPENKVMVLAPHLLSEKNVNKIQKTLEDFKLSVAKIDQSTVEIPSADIYIVAEKGLLCELYSCFQLAIVGGGHTKSVHSLLEPYLAGCQLWCGPLIHRSTEYDLIFKTNPESITLVDESENYFHQIHFKRQERDQAIYDDVQAVLELIHRL